MKHRFLLIPAFLLLLAGGIPAAAEDELFLTGFIKQIDSLSGIITVEVQSQSCPGIKTFTIENVTDLEASEGKKISFFLNSSTCDPHKTYAIHDITFMKGIRP